MRVALVFPPQWTAAQPHFALASLNGQLRRAGHEVVIHDLNLALVEHILDPSTLRLSERRLSSARRLLPMEIALLTGTGGSAARVDVAAERLAAIEAYSGLGSGRVNDVVAAAREVSSALRSPDGFYAPPTYAANMAALDEALRLFSLPFHPAELRWNHFGHPHCPLNLEPLIALCQSNLENPFRTFYEDAVEELLRPGVDLIAVSINAFSQVVPGLTLALMLERARGADIRPHLSLGGNFFTRLRDRLVALPQLFETFTDSIVLGEGELPILALVEALERGHDLERVPSLLHKDAASGSVCAHKEAPNLAMQDLAFQDLSGFPLDRYLSPERVICVRASKGCYWGQCTFCDSYHGLTPDQVSAERFVAELQHLHRQHGIRHFELVDQCLSPAYADQLCRAIRAADLDIEWFFNARTEPGFTSELLRDMRDAGVTMVMWGVESGSPRLLKLMKKGVSADRRLEILRRSADAGIFNFAYVFFGFPTETEHEAQSTISLLSDNTDIIHGYGKSVFSLGRHAPLMAERARFGILRTVEDTQELSTNLSFDVASGLDGAALQGVLDRCNAECREAYDDPLWMLLRSREALHLYLAHHGRDWVRDYRLSSASAEEDQPEFVF